MSSHDQHGRNLRAYLSRLKCACWSDLLAPRGTIIDSGLGPTGQIKKEAREAKEAEAKSAIVEALLAADDGVLTSTELKVACGGNAALHTGVRDAMATGSVDEPAQLGHSKSGRTVTYWLTDPKAWITLDLDQAEERSHWSKSKKVTK